MAKRPLTVREMQARKAKKETADIVRILNTSKQLVTIHLRSPKKEDGKRVDFFLGAVDKPIRPNQHIEVVKDRLWESQIERLSKRGMIRVILDTSNLES